MTWLIYKIYMSYIVLHESGLENLNLKTWVLIGGLG